MKAGAVALSSLRPRYHALVFTVDASLWLGFIISSGGTHRFWPCSVNILEHSGCSGGSPGALYLNNIIYLYNIIYIITAKSCVHLQMILWISNDCVGFCNVSGSYTSTSIWSTDWPRHEKGIVAVCRLPVYISTTRLVVGVISAMIEKEFVERNFAFVKATIHSHNTWRHQGLTKCRETPKMPLSGDSSRALISKP